jgi:hypothetical protein
VKNLCRLPKLGKMGRSAKLTCLKRRLNAICELMLASYVDYIPEFLSSFSSSMFLYFQLSSVACERTVDLEALYT